MLRERSTTACSRRVVQQCECHSAVTAVAVLRRAAGGPPRAGPVPVHYTAAMGRFSDRATQPARGPRDILKWRFGAKDPRPDNFAELDKIRPAVVGGGAEALASGAPVACWIGHATWAFRLGGVQI